MEVETNAGHKLSRRVKFVYGLGDWGTSAANSARLLFWLLFLVNVVGIRVELAGTVMLAGKVWDGINDPLVGMFSDRLESRWGRRRPFLLFGAVPFGLTFFLLFVVPPLKSETALAVYYGFIFLLFDSIYTLINVPYTALTAELTDDYDERSSLAGWRMATAILASLVVAATFKVLAENVIAANLESTMGVTQALRTGYALTAALWSLTLILPPLILFKNIEEPVRVPPDRDPWRPLETIRQVFSNRPFRLAAVIYLLTFSTVDIVATTMIWFLVFYVRARTGFDSLVLGLVLGIGFVTMPLTVKLMHRFGKRRAYIGSMFAFAVALFFISRVPPGGELQLIVAAVATGLGYGAANVVPWAIVADVVEEDELHSGKRREGIYAGYLVFFRKLSGAILVYVIAQVLAANGFIESTTGSRFIEQPESAVQVLRFFIGVVPVVMLALAMLAAWRYPLDRDSHAEIRRQLARQRAMQAKG